MTREELIVAAEQAREVLDSPALQAAVETVRDDWRAQWTNSKVWQEREELWHLDQALTKVLAQLRVAIGRGLQARAEIDAQARRATPARG